MGWGGSEWHGIYMYMTGKQRSPDLESARRLVLLGSFQQSGALVSYIELWYKHIFFFMIYGVYEVYMYGIWYMMYIVHG